MSREEERDRDRDHPDIIVSQIEEDSPLLFLINNDIFSTLNIKIKSIYRSIIPNIIQNITSITDNHYKKTLGI